VTAVDGSAWSTHRRQRSYTEEEIFTDEDVARQFRTELLRLTELGGSGTGAGVIAAARWDAYLAECEHLIGLPLTRKLFGLLAQLTPEPAREPEPADGVSPAEMQVMVSERPRWRNWIERLVASVATDRPGLELYRLLTARIMILLLAFGVWDADDQSWRDLLAELASHLVPGPGSDVPGQVRQLAYTYTAISVGLLRGGASLTGAAHADLLVIGVPGGLGRPRLLIVEADPVMDIVADRLDPRPAGRRLLEQPPRNVGEPVGLAIAAAKQIDQDFHRQVFQLVLLRLWGDNVWLAIVLHNEVCGHCEPARRSADHVAEIAELS